MQIILNADDFGRSPHINAAVIQAHRQGVLTSTSLMVMEDAVGEAVSLARETPSLAVGLHTVMACGKALLPRCQIPHIVDRNGRFPDNAFWVGLNYLFSQTAREELTCELKAQFDRFIATGLPLSHVDSHVHMHVHPIVFDLLLSLAEQYGAQGFRLPRDDFRLAIGYSHHRAMTKAVWALVFGCLNRRGVGRLRKSRLVFTHRVFGLMQTGQMQEAYVVEMLHRLTLPSAEFYFHPSMIFEGETLGPNPGDLATLLSPAVKRVIEERGLRLATYPTLDRLES